MQDLACVIASLKVFLSDRKHTTTSSRITTNSIPITYCASEVPWATLLADDKTRREIPYTNTKRQRPRAPPFDFENSEARLLHRHADFSFMHRLIEVINRLYAMAFEIVFGNVEFVLGCAHMLQRLVDVRMPFRRGDR